MATGESDRFRRDTDSLYRANFLMTANGGMDGEDLVGQGNGGSCRVSLVARATTP